MRDWSSDVCSSDLYLVVVLHLEARLDDLLAPLQRAVGGHARAGRLQLRAHRQQIGVFLASALDRERRPGCRMRVRNDKKVELLQRLYRFRHACDAVDRKSVVSGKSVSVRVDFGGRRIIKKKKKNKRRES